MLYLNILICVEYLSRKSCIWCSKGPPLLRMDGSRAPCWAGLVLAVLTRGCGDATKSTGVSACYYRNIVKHKSAKLFMTYAVGKLEAALNISHLILSTSSQRVS